MDKRTQFSPKNFDVTFLKVTMLSGLSPHTPTLLSSNQSGVGVAKKHFPE